MRADAEEAHAGGVRPLPIERPRLLLVGKAERAGEAKVGKHELVVTVYEQVGGLEVAVEDPARVQLGERDDLRRVCMTSDIGEKTRGEGGHVPAAQHISERRPRRYGRS